MKRLKRLKRLLCRSEYHALLFCLGFVLMNWPFLSIFQHKSPENLFRYLFSVWGAAILLLLIVGGSCKRAFLEENAGEEKDKRDKGDGRKRDD